MTKSVYFDKRAQKWRAVIWQGDVIDSPTFPTEAEARSYVGLDGGCVRPKCPACRATGGTH